MKRKPEPARARRAPSAKSAPPAARRVLKMASEGFEGLLGRGGAADTWSLNRLYLLVPVVLLLTASAVLALNSTLQGAVLFGAAVLMLAVYLQDMTRPLALPHLRANALALLAQAPALPFQCAGVWLLYTQYDRPAMVWLGFFICLAASAWMYFALGRWPVDLVPKGAAETSLGWSAPAPFYSTLRVTVLLSFVVLAALAACLALYVFPGDYAVLAVAAGFLAMGLLVASFPWMPSGLAFRAGVSPAAGAAIALGSAGLAFLLGAHGQDLIERGDVNAGLWFFLAGGLVLVAGLSRFEGERARAAAAPGRGMLRLEILAVAALVVAAFAMRAWKVGSFPFGAEGDEAGGGVWAMNVLKGDVENHFINQNYPLAFFSVTAFFFKFAGVTLATLRWHAVFFGTLSVFTAYFFMRLNMGRGASFLATLLMVFSYWHLHFSRFGHYNIEQVAVQMAAFYFVFKGMRTGRLWQWGVGGLAFGLAMFPHMAGRILPFEGIALLLYLFAARRDLLAKYLPGFLAFLVVAWAVSSPAVVYWKRAQNVSMSRINDVSIFDKNNSNAPIDTLAGFVSNCRSSMLMFNYQGDARPRDNPVAPDKILEHWTAILFGLALLYVLYHWREPVNFFLLSVFFMNLCASIFSVEAPQTLRTAGNIPIVFALVAVPLADLGGAVRRAGRPLSRAVFLALLAAFSFFGWRSARRLFVDQRNLQFDTAATYIARTAGVEGGPTTQAVFWGTGFGSAHPPMLLFRLNTPLKNFYGPFEYLPVTQSTDQDHLLFLTDSYEQMLPYLRWLYPSAPVKTIPDQQGGPLAYYLRVDAGMLSKSEGLDGSARIGGAWVPVQGANPRWPSPGLEAAREVKVSGSLAVDEYGTYGLSATGSGDAEITLDGREVFRRRGGSVRRQGLLLGKGLHDLAWHFKPASAADGTRLRLEGLAPGPNAPWALRILGASDVARSHVLRVPASGFAGEYFASRSPQGKPVLETVEPIVLNHWLDSPLLGNWSARWRTRFEVTAPGRYSFNANGGNFTQVEVDKKTVWRQGQPPDKGAEFQKSVQTFIQLSKGWHDYQAVFSTSGPPACDLNWVTPDGKSGIFWQLGLRPDRR